jgi:hypothetical protein
MGSESNRSVNVQLFVNIYKILIDGYDIDLISVASDRVESQSPNGWTPRGINTEVRSYVLCARFLLYTASV